MSYSIYRSQTRLMIKLAQLMGQKVTKSNSQACQRLAEDLIMSTHIQSGCEPHTFMTSTLGRVVLQENLWINQDNRRTIFLDSPTLVNNLLQARFACDMLACPDKPVRFALAMPAQMSHGSAPIQPMLVTIGESQAIIDEHVRVFGERWGMNVSATNEHQGQLAILISTRALEASECAPEARGADHPYLSLLVAGPQIPELLNADPDLPLTDILPILQERFGADLSIEEQKMQVLQARLALSFWIYWQANPGAITEGTPGRVQDGDAPVLGKALEMRASNPAGASDVREASSEHYRRWHFRQLRDQRYYRGEFEALPIGSRWVFVSDAYVNRESGDDYTASQP